MKQSAYDHMTSGSSTRRNNVTRFYRYLKLLSVVGILCLVISNFRILTGSVFQEFATAGLHERHDLQLRQEFLQYHRRKDNPMVVQNEKTHPKNTSELPNRKTDQEISQNPNLCLKEKLQQFQHRNQEALAHIRGGKKQKQQKKRSVLKDLKILVSIVMFDFGQLPHFEEVVDGYYDISLAAKQVDIVIYTCVVFPVAWIDMFNKRWFHDDHLSNPNFSITFVVKSASISLHLPDYHRSLFYDFVDDYDLFIFTEDDIRVTPGTVATYWKETQVIQERFADVVEDYETPQADDRPPQASDFNIGIVRYEYDYPDSVVIDDKTRHAIQNVTRVYWEHNPFHFIQPVRRLRPAQYFQMKSPHQGMYLATSTLLKAWQKRPGCSFHIASERPGNGPNNQMIMGTQRVWMSSFHLYTKDWGCGVHQSIPAGKFGRLTVHHLPNKNYRRIHARKAKKEGFVLPENNAPLDLNQTEVFLLTEMHTYLSMKKAWPESLNQPQTISYRGIHYIDEVSQGRHEALDIRLQDFHNYVNRGAYLSQEDMSEAKVTHEPSACYFSWCGRGLDPAQFKKNHKP